MTIQHPELSVVLGSLNRRRLLQQTVRSIRTNGFHGAMEIIVIDGGSTDGTCEWLARQRDVLTLVQPNFRIRQADGSNRRAHTWGEFINLGFRQARAPWILMVSDDVVLCPGAMENGLVELRNLQKQGKKVGGGAMFWREYPRDRNYHVKLLPGGFVHINHGFFLKEALAAVGYADETSFEFYGADGDLTMRLNLDGWRTCALENSYAEHLSHRLRWRRLLSGKAERTPNRDMETFARKYGHMGHPVQSMKKDWQDSSRAALAFWKTDWKACVEGIVRRGIQHG